MSCLRLEKKMHTFVLLFWNQTYEKPSENVEMKALVLCQNFSLKAFRLRLEMKGRFLWEPFNLL